MMKIPYILVVGEQEITDNTVNVRTRDGKQLGSAGLGDFAAACAREIVERSLSTSPEAGSHACGDHEKGG